MLLLTTLVCSLDKGYDTGLCLETMHDGLLLHLCRERRAKEQYLARVGQSCWGEQLGTQFVQILKEGASFFGRGW